MRYKRLGRAGLLVSELSLGTNTFGGKSSEVWRRIGGLEQQAAEAIIGRAVEAGINLFDTADIYAAGESEEIIGRAIRNLRIDRGNVFIATKIGGRTGQQVNSQGASRGHLLRGVEASLKRLQTDYLDVLMMHYFDPATPMEESLRTLDNLVRAGKVRYLGCSNFAAWQVMKALDIATRENLERFEVIEANWSPASRGLEREILPMARDQRVGILVWGPLLGGLLSGKYTRDGGGKGIGRTGGEVPPILDREKVFDVVDALRTIGARRAATASQVALAWLLRQPGLTSVLFGARAPEHVDENVGATSVRLEDDDLALIDAAYPPVPDYGPWVVRNSAAARAEYA